MTLSEIETAAHASGMMIMGAFHPENETAGTMILVGGDAGMWPAFTSSPEHSDGADDPLDRWSKRVIGKIATRHKAKCVFPSDGPPYAPFTRWSLESGRFWQSPAGMLVHDTAGLMVSIRGAICLAEKLDLPPAVSANPCDGCSDRPCISSCPVDALKGIEYDVASCKDHLLSEEGAECMTRGCIARRACPVSRAFNRAPDQTAFHMRAFLCIV